MIFIGHFLPECILLRLVVNLQPLVRQRAIHDCLFIVHVNCNNCPLSSVAVYY